MEKVSRRKFVAIAAVAVPRLLFVHPRDRLPSLLSLLAELAAI